jgi:hypothetical protein
VTGTATAPARQAMATAVLVLDSGVSPADAADLCRAFLDTVDRTCLYPTVLAGADLERDSAGLLDGLRNEGIPVMVARPIRGFRAAVSIAALLELVFWLRSADAKVVHIAAGDRRLAQAVSRARQFARGIESVVEVPRTTPPLVEGGSR